MVLDGVLAYGEGGLPATLPTAGAPLAERFAELRARAADIGRPLPTVTYYRAEADVEVIQRMRDAGVERVIFKLPTASQSETERALDKFAALMS